MRGEQREMRALSTVEKKGKTAREQQIGEIALLRVEKMEEMVLLRVEKMSGPGLWTVRSGATI